MWVCVCLCVFVCVCLPPHLICIGKQPLRNLWSRMQHTEKKSPSTIEEEGCRKCLYTQTQSGWFVWEGKLPTLHLGKDFSNGSDEAVLLHLHTKQLLFYTSKIALSLSAHSTALSLKPLILKCFLLPSNTNTRVPLLFCRVHWGQKTMPGLCVFCEQEHVLPSDFESSWQRHQTFMRGMERLWRTVWTQGYRERERGRDREPAKVNGTYQH